MADVRSPDLSILIVSWNVRDHVLACLSSIEADGSRPDTEIILVDNASMDGTVAAVKQAHPNVRVVANTGNAGFPAANNQALALARGRHVLFLNPDTEVRPGTLAACVAELDRDGTIGALGCRVELPDGRIQYEGGRSRYRFRHLVYEVAYLHMVMPQSRVFGEHLIGHWDHRGTREVGGLSGAFMMTPKEAALEVGGLPEDLFMYHEDLAFCLRVARTGRRVVYFDGGSILHHGGASSAKSDARLGLLEVEAKRRLIREGDGAIWAALSRPVFAARSLVRLAMCVVGVILTPAVRKRYARVFDWQMHLLQLCWAIVPPLTSSLMPRAPGGGTRLAALPQATS